MTRIERLKEIIKYRNQLKKKYAKEYKGKLRKLNGKIMYECMKKFEISHTEYYHAITLNNFRKNITFLYNLLDSGRIQNFDLAVRMYRFSKRSTKYGIKDVWNEMLKLSDNPTNKHFLVFASDKEGFIYTEKLIKNPLDGRELTREQWAKELQICYNHFVQRLQLYKKGKMSVENLFSVANTKLMLYKNPIDGRELDFYDWVKELKISKYIFRKRWTKYNKGEITAKQMFAKNLKVT